MAGVMSSRTAGRATGLTWPVPRATMGPSATGCGGRQSWERDAGENHERNADNDDDAVAGDHPDGPDHVDDRQHDAHVGADVLDDVANPSSERPEAIIRKRVMAFFCGVKVTRR